MAELVRVTASREKEIVINLDNVTSIQPQDADWSMVIFVGGGGELVRGTPASISQLPRLSSARAI